VSLDSGSFSNACYHHHSFTNASYLFHFFVLIPICDDESIIRREGGQGKDAGGEKSEDCRERKKISEVTLK